MPYSGIALRMNGLRRFFQRAQRAPSAIPAGALSVAEAQHSSNEPVQAYQMLLVCKTPLVSEAALEHLWAMCREYGLNQQQVQITTQSSAKQVRLGVQVRCTAFQKRGLARFVRELDDWSGMRQVSWETMPRELAHA